MEIADHVASVRSEGELLAHTAGRLPLDAPVPSCPGWRLRDLVAHLGFVHRWATAYVAGEQTEMTDGPGEEEILKLAPAGESLVGWFRDGHARLVSALAAADPAIRCWTFLEAPSPLAFWARRQAHETAIHRADAQLAAAAATLGEELRPYPAQLAADGIDELIMGFGRRHRRRLAGPPGELRIRADDGAGDAGTGASWTVLIRPDGGRVSRGQPPGPAGGDRAAGGDSGARADRAAGDERGAGAGRYCEVSGSAADLYLMLWNRRSPAGLDVQGDAGLLESWREHMHVRWS
jgi:uncharacterized protein (TIGR03083 family)